MRQGITVGVAVLALALAVSVAAGAQPVDSFEELGGLIEIGRSVVVITSPDRELITGQLVDISPASLSVFAGGRRIELDEARVRRVRQRWNDPTSDGAALGFLAGSVPPLVLYAMYSGGEGEEIAGLVLLTGLTGTAGALIGVALECARQTGGGQPVRVRRKEGVTDHLHPESCAGRCEAAGEALTGARTGRAIEHRKHTSLERRDLSSGRRPHRHHRDG